MRVPGLVSIVVPVFNAESFLPQAIESVRSQRYADWELLLVEDGSTDRSPEIARRYADEDSTRIHYLQHANHRNLGMCASRNLGVRHSRGEFIAHLDADDLWIPDKLQLQIELMRRHPTAEMLYGRSMYFEEGKSSESGQVDIPAPCGLYEAPALLQLTYPLGPESPPTPSEYFLRYELHQKVGGFEEAFDAQGGMYEDIAFLTKVFLHARVLIAEHCWTRIRCHKGSSTQRLRAQNPEYEHRGRLFYLAWLENYLRGQNVRQAEIWQAVERLLWPYDHPVLARAERLMARVSGKISRGSR